jgi:hypothetical protein
MKQPINQLTPRSACGAPPLFFQEMVGVSYPNGGELKPRRALNQVTNNN